MDKSALPVDPLLGVTGLSPEDQDALDWVLKQFAEGRKRPFRDPNEEEH